MENTKIRVIEDPSRVGFVTGRERILGDVKYLLVQFPDKPEWLPIDILELAEEQQFDDPITLLEKGRLGKAIDLRSGLTHIRLCGRLADVLYSMEVSNTDFYAYQFKPVLKMINSPVNGILIADEVGLGKTIEAGLIWTELRSRINARRLLVVCPAMLRIKWKNELKSRFGVSATICNAEELLERFKDAIKDGLNSEFTIICSIQGIRPEQDIFLVEIHSKTGVNK